MSFSRVSRVLLETGETQWELWERSPPSGDRSQVSCISRRGFLHFLAPEIGILSTCPCSPARTGRVPGSRSPRPSARGVSAGRSQVAGGWGARREAGTAAAATRPPGAGPRRGLGACRAAGAIRPASPAAPAAPAFREESQAVAGAAAAQRAGRRLAGPPPPGPAGRAHPARGGQGSGAPTGRRPAALPSRSPRPAGTQLPPAWPSGRGARGGRGGGGAGGGVWPVCPVPLPQTGLRTARPAQPPGTGRGTRSDPGRTSDRVRAGRAGEGAGKPAPGAGRQGPPMDSGIKGEAPCGRETAEVLSRGGGESGRGEPRAEEPAGPSISVFLPGALEGTLSGRALHLHPRPGSPGRGGRGKPPASWWRAGGPRSG